MNSVWPFQIVECSSLLKVEINAISHHCSIAFISASMDSWILNQSVWGSRLTEDAMRLCGAVDILTVCRALSAPHTWHGFQAAARVLFPKLKSTTGTMLSACTYSNSSLSTDELEDIRRLELHSIIKIILRSIFAGFFLIARHRLISRQGHSAHFVNINPNNGRLKRQIPRKIIWINLFRVHVCVRVFVRLIELLPFRKYTAHSFGRPGVLHASQHTHTQSQYSPLDGSDSMNIVASSKASFSA